MALNADEQKLLQELTDRANAPDEDDDFEIEVYDTSQGKGARIPFRTGKNWLHSTFGIGDGPAPATGGEESAGDEGGTPPTKSGQGAYFGRAKKS